MIKKYKCIFTKILIEIDKINIFLDKCISHLLTYTKKISHNVENKL